LWIVGGNPLANPSRLTDAQTGEVAYGETWLNAEMKLATLYVLTAVVTGLQNFYRLMDRVNGAPINPLNCVALVGSVTLIGAAFLVPFKPHVAAGVGTTGSLLSWVFYGPLLVVSFLMPFSAWSDVRSFFFFHEYIPLAVMILAPVLLIACTVNSILILRRRRIGAG
jgi:hypothetical protein